MFKVLMTLLTVGAFFGCLSEPGAEKKSTKPITPAWKRVRKRLATSLEKRVKIGVVSGFIVAIGSTLYTYLSDVSNWSLGSRIVGALSGGLPGGMCIGVCVGLSLGLARSIEPLEGSRWSCAGIRREHVRCVLISSILVVRFVFAFPFLIVNH